MKKKTHHNTFNGIVMRSTGNLHQVKNDAGEILECRIKGKLRMQGMRTTNPVAVGDKVQYELETDKPEAESRTNTKGVIIAIDERQNCIVRKSVNLSKHAHIIAANIDRAYLIITLAKPQTSTVFIDRFLVTAEAYRIPVTLIFNKTDIYNADEQQQLSKLSEIYSNTGYSCLPISALNPDDVVKIREQLIDKVNLFSGHSGVGKSTLINAIDPSLDLKVGEISEQYGEGKHTTTFAEMFALKGYKSTYIVDTPGIRGFGIVDIDKEVIANYFPEFFAIHQNCKFSNCQHIKEPHCAVRAAVSEGEIAEFRYANYLSIYDADDADQYRRNTRQ